MCFVHELVELVLGRFVATLTLVQEKFLTIRHFLCGKRSEGQRATELLVVHLKSMFAALQVPFANCCVAAGKRYSFISYNFVFRRLFDLLGVSHFGIDFPPLKSRRKREDILCIWSKMISYLKWPYLNSDGDLFGDEYSSSLTHLLRKRGHFKPARKRARTDTSGDPGGF